MDLDAMKVIWDTQTDAPLYAINEQTLRRTIQGKARRFKRLVLFFEAIMLVVMLGLGGYYLAYPFLAGTHIHRLVAGLISLGAATYFFLGIRHRWRQEMSFPNTLLGDLDRALWQVRYHIARSLHIRWSLIAPMCLAVSIDAVFAIDSLARLGVLAAFLGLMGVATWGIRYEIACLYAPRERHLTNLRTNLVDTPHPSDPPEVFA